MCLVDIAEVKAIEDESVLFLHLEMLVRNFSLFFVMIGV